jgi:hypothetical protein
MTQLTFQPAFDPFHAVFRLFRLNSTITAFGPLHRDHVRILDFFLLFPFRIEGIRLAPKHRRYRRLAQKYQSARPYGDQPEDQIIFGRMEPIQIAAIETLGARGWIVSDQLIVGQVQATSAPIPEEIASRTNAANERDAELIDFLGILASEYGLTGVNGLKGRTNLLEHRYDAV